MPFVTESRINCERNIEYIGNNYKNERSIFKFRVTGKRLTLSLHIVSSPYNKGQISKKGQEWGRNKLHLYKKGSGWTKF